jgi:hypothetical protein
MLQKISGVPVHHSAFILVAKSFFRPPYPSPPAGGRGDKRKELLANAIGLSLDNFLDEFFRLPIEDQKMLLDILKKRNIELKRLKIAREVKEAQREHKKGLTKRGMVEDLIKDLESD